MKSIRVVALVAPLVAGILFTRLVRPWYLRWGATDEEVQRPMPLDQHVPSPRLASTMAITIESPPERIWPWLAQIGDAPRAGYYSYAWIERLMGMHIDNAGKILPEFQHLAVGDVLDRAGTMTVLDVSPGRHLVLGPPPTVPVTASWAFALYPVDAHRTRLVTRVRGSWNPLRMLRDTPPVTWPFYLLMEPGAFVMERKMLLEIRKWAESMPDNGRSPELTRN